MRDSPHLLIVDDEPALVHMLKATLDYGGYTSEVARTALEALRCLGNRTYDAVLLDLSLPDVDGAHLIKTVRESSDAAIIVVSGRGTEVDKINTLDLGADDFVEKPFLPGELLARIRAVLRRRSQQPGADRPAADENAHAAGNGSSAFNIASPDSELRLAPMEEKLLKLLESRDGEVASSEEIARTVWGPRKRRGSNHVRVLVAHLRRKLELEGQPLEIANERGAGYRLRKLSEPV